MSEEITMLSGLPGYGWGNNNARFVHIFGKWGAAYYGYMVLEGGGSREQHLDLEKFLGRKPISQSFIRKLDSSK